MIYDNIIIKQSIKEIYPPQCMYVQGNTPVKGLKQN